MEQVSHIMCPRKEYIETLKLDKGGVVHLCDNKAYKVLGIGMERLNIFDDREYFLHNVRYVPKIN